jgi:hypothetical protein
MVPDAGASNTSTLAKFSPQGLQRFLYGGRLLNKLKICKLSISNEVLCNFPNRFALDYLASWRAAPLAK